MEPIFDNFIMPPSEPSSPKHYVCANSIEENETIHDIPDISETLDRITQPFDVNSNKYHTGNNTPTSFVNTPRMHKHKHIIPTDSSKPSCLKNQIHHHVNRKERRIENNRHSHSSQQQRSPEFKALSPKTARHILSSYLDHENRTLNKKRTNRLPQTKQTRMSNISTELLFEERNTDWSDNKAKCGENAARASRAGNKRIHSASAEQNRTRNHASFEDLLSTRRLAILTDDHEIAITPKLSQELKVRLS